MEGGDEVFIINSAEEVQAEEAQVAPSVENTREAEAEALENAKGLVPLCVQHVRGPELSTAVFGYDIAQMVKRPWAEPGVKLSDYFNYGFNEQSWRVYCAMQRNGEESLLAKATEMLQKLEATGRPAVGAEAEAGVAAADPSMHAPMMGGGGGMEGYNANPYGGGYGGEMAGRGGYGGGRPFNNVHQQQQQPPRDFHGGMGGGGGDVRGHNANYKTRICKSFAEGHCNRGESCNYAHGVAELRQPGGGVTPFQQGGPQMMGGAPMQQQQQQQQEQQQQQQQPSGHGYGAAAFYPTGSAPPPPERTTNYLMPPGQAGGGNPMPPMMQPNMMMSHEGEGSGGFRQPPKRQRHEGGGGGGVYEPQY